MEKFKQIEGYNYKVYKDGTVVNMSTNKPLKIDIVKGYARVYLYKDGVKKGFLVHVLVAKAFVPNPHGYEEVNHLDEDKLNNNDYNLAWCTRTDNINYGKCRENISNSLKRFYTEDRYKDARITRAEFKRICKRRGWNFEEFKEVEVGMNKFNKRLYSYIKGDKI